jgi:sulfite reductase alpha subunit-like flavoprotein
MSHSTHDDDSTDGEGNSRTLTILYATETGNAQNVSERIARLARRLHLEVQVASLDKYEAVTTH